MQFVSPVLSQSEYDENFLLKRNQILWYLLNQLIFAAPNTKCPDGEIGRRTVFRSQRPQGCAGSNPVLGTSKGFCILQDLFYFRPMYHVYAIKSSVRHYVYIGITDNIERRLSQHNSGRNKTTKPYRPFEVIYTETFNTRLEAREKEKYLKSGTGREFLKTLF